MSVLTNIFSDIANALRSKMGVNDTYTPAQMAPAINNIPTGGQHIDNSYQYVAGVNFVEEETISITVASDLFRNNQNMIYDMYYFGDSVTSLANCFYGCTYFNSYVKIGNNVTNMAQTFKDCHNFNQPITIPNSVTNMAQTFNNCRNFNQPITIPNSVNRLTAAFINCRNFNQPIIMPDYALISYCFCNCCNFNQPIILPNNAAGVGNCFLDCHEFNQPVVIPSKTDIMAGAFKNCYNFNQPITIPPKVTSVTSLFENCTKFKGPVYFTNAQKISSCINLFKGCNNSLIKIIYCNDATKFISYTNEISIVGAPVIWDAAPDGNGYWNATYNIYIYNNWTPT